jgi:tRNA 2-selenouridine synthase
MFNDFKRIVIDQLPLIDVRAPIEFEKGKFEGAVNLPIMTDEERHKVGICYKEKGNVEAIALGYRMVSDDTREARIKAWSDFLEMHPGAIIYCSRGGQRSKIAQNWIEEATGIHVPRIEGGFKAFRGYLMNALEPEHQHYEPIVLGGYTGAGKTVVLKRLPNTIDLEAMANHRGSSFGGFITPQPSQIDFEHTLAYGLIRFNQAGHKTMVLENEGARIGRSCVHKPLAEFLNSNKLVIVEKSLEDRAKAITEEYVIEAQETFSLLYDVESGFMQWKTSIISGLSRIVKRLGLERHSQILNVFENACTEQLQTGFYTAHEEWVQLLLAHYYDPMYKYQLDRDASRIVFTGDSEAVYTYLKEQE